MAHLSVRLPDSVIADLNALAETQHRSKAEVVREALEQYRLHRLLLAKKERLSNASLRVRSSSMLVNEDFAAFESGPNEA
jgi:Arc/MetJ-type ribon-helix-helix transcriptional regulator